MSTATLTSKGQITIPAEVRKALRVHAGDRVRFVPVEPGVYQFIAVTHPVSELKGLLAGDDPPLTTAAMDEAVAARGAGSA